MSTNTNSGGLPENNVGVALKKAAIEATKSSKKTTVVNKTPAKKAPAKKAPEDREDLHDLHKQILEGEFSPQDRQQELDKSKANGVPHLMPKIGMLHRNGEDITVVELVASYVPSSGVVTRIHACGFPVGRFGAMRVVRSRPFFFSKKERYYPSPVDRVAAEIDYFVKKESKQYQNPSPRNEAEKALEPGLPFWRLYENSTKDLPDGSLLWKFSVARRGAEVALQGGPEGSALEKVQEPIFLLDEREIAQAHMLEQFANHTGLPISNQSQSLLGRYGKTGICLSSSTDIGGAMDPHEGLMEIFQAQSQTELDQKVAPLLVR